MSTRPSVTSSAAPPVDGAARGERDTTRPARWLALAALTTSLPALVGWLLGVRSLVQPVATFAPTHPWSAALPILASSAMLAKLGGHRRVAAWLAVLGTGLALLGVGFGLGNVVLPGDAWLHARFPSLTAVDRALPVSLGLLYVLHASALLLLLAARRGPQAEQRQQVVGALASLQVGIAGAQFLTQLVGLSEGTWVAAWRAPLSGLLAMLLLGAALLQRVGGGEPTPTVSPRWGPLLVAVSGTLVVASLWQALRVREQANAQARDALTYASLDRAVQRQFRSLNRAIGRTAAFLAASGDEVPWRTTLPRLVAETDGLQGIAWLDSTGRVLQSVVPEQSALAAVLQPAYTPAFTRFVQRHADALDDAMPARMTDTIAARHTDLLGAAPSRLVLWYPVVSPVRGPTLLVAFVDERALLQLLQDESNGDVALRVSVGDSVLLARGRLGNAPSRRTLRLGVRDFQVELTQGGGAPSTLPGVVLTLGLAVVWLLAVTLWQQRRLFEQARGEGMARMQRAIEGATDGVWELDVATGLASRSAGLLRHLGLDAAEAPDGLVPWRARVHPEDAARLQQALDQHLAGRTEVFECAYRVQAVDGSWHTLVDRGRVVERDARGAARRLLGVSADVTERERADAARDASERRFRAMFDTAYQVQVLLDLDGTILEANRAAAELAGVSPDALQGATLWRAPWWAEQPQTVQRVEERFRRAAAGELQRFEVEVTSGRDRPVTIDFSLTPILDAQRAVTQVIAEGRDLTLRIRAEEALREASTLTTLGQLAARVAHEINNPLAGIQNAFLLVRGAIPPEHPHHHFVGAIEREIGRIAAVTRQLYETYRPDPAHATQASVVLAVGDAVSFLEQVNRGRQVRVVTDLAQAPSVVPVPDALLRQALYNLVQNAFDVSPPQGTITVRAAVDGDACVLTVSDEGPGVPAALRERIFEPFFSTKDRSTKTGGMGIGLALVRQSVHAVGGRVSVHERPGGGAAFEVRLPLTPLETGALT